MLSTVVHVTTHDLPLTFEKSPPKFDQTLPFDSG